MSRIVVAEELSPAGLEILRKAGHEVALLAGADRKRLLAELASADALLVRSRTKVDAELLAAAPHLTVVGRAGVGVDNVDVPAASARGVLVINAPTGNVVSAVEHTFALLLALLRRVSEASVSLASGKWEKSKFLGSELAGKTLGIVGLGQVGSRVAARARAFEARLLGHDPYLPLEKAREMGVPLVSLEELLESSDIVTLHATATEGGRPLIGREELARMKPGAVLVNVARGSLVDGEALHQALASGRLAGAALDVFDPEPPDPNDPLLKLPNVVATPHLGASTVEAQERVSLQTAEAVAEALGGASYVPAVNLPFRGPKDAGGAAAWMDVAERTGRFLSCLAGERLGSLSVETWGLPEDFLRPIAVASVKGALQAHTPETVNFVNALFVARPGRFASRSRTDARRRSPTRPSFRATTRASSRWMACRSSSDRKERSSSCGTATSRASSAAWGRFSAKEESTSRTSRSRAAAETAQRRSSRSTRFPPRQSSRSSARRRASKRCGW